MRTILLAATLALIVTQLRSQAGDVNSLLSQWNVITSENLDYINGDIQGNAYVGNDVTANNSFNVGTAGPTLLPVSDISLAVGGDIESGGNIQVNGGSVVVGGTISPSRTINMNSGGTINQDDPSGLPNSPVSEITSASQYWSTLAANSSTSVSASDQLDFNCAATPSLAVFNISAATMFGSGYQGFTLIPSSSTSEVIINVNGADVNWSTGSFFSEFNTSYWDGRVLFNFYNATTVTLSGQIGGYTVAPNADVTLDSSVDGGVMAENLTADGEVDLPESGSASAWEGSLPNVPVPEVSTSVSGFGALVMFACVIWRERKNSAITRIAPRYAAGRSTPPLPIA